MSRRWISAASRMGFACAVRYSRAEAHLAFPDFFVKIRDKERRRKSKRDDDGEDLDSGHVSTSAVIDATYVPRTGHIAEPDWPVACDTNMRRASHESNRARVADHCRGADSGVRGVHVLERHRVGAL